VKGKNRLVPEGKYEKDFENFSRNFYFIRQSAKIQKQSG